MKNAFAILFCLVYLGPLMALTIYSTTAGGNWSDSATWVGGMAPNSGDNVVINSTVYVDNVNSPHGCANLTVGGSGDLMNQPGNQTGVVVNGSLLNLGTIRNYAWGYNPGNLTIMVSNAINNSGTFTAWHLNLSGMNAQHLSNSGSFNPWFLEDTYSYSPLVLDTDLVVGAGTNILMNNASLVLNGSSVHHLTGYGYGGQGSLRDAQIVGGNGASITCNDGFWLQNTTADEIVLQGGVQIIGHLNVDYLINYAQIYTPIYGTSDLNVMERLDNHGSVMNHPAGGTFNLNLYGSLYNFATLSNYQTNLAGTELHLLWQSPAAPAITCSYLTSSSSGSARLISDLSFTGTGIDLNGNQVILFDPITDESYGITQSGGYIRNTVFSGGETSELNLNALYLENVTADRIVFNGNFELKGTVTAGILANNAILRNVAYQSATLSVTQSLAHHGELNNHGAGGSLYLALGGDFYDYGLLTNYRVDFVGGNEHQIWQSASAPVIWTPNIYAPDAGNPVRLLSNLRLSGTRFEFYSNTLTLHDGRADFSLDLQNCRLVGVHLVGGNTSVLYGAAAFLQDSSAENIITSGTVFVAGGVTIGRLTNQGVLRNQDYWTSTLVVSQRLANYQSVTNSLYGGVLYLETAGDLYNYGEIYVYRLLVNGTTDQYVRNAGTIGTSQGCQLVSELGPAQWYFNGSLANANYVANQAVDPYQTGIWRPFLDGVWGRQITFGEGSALAAPASVAFAVEGTVLRLSWAEVPNAVYYRVYSAPAPTGPFTVLHSAILDPSLGDGWAGCDFQVANPQRYYRVTALN